MRTFLKDLIAGNKNPNKDYVYFDMTTEELAEEWFEKGKKNKVKGISHKATIEQATLTFDEAGLSINAKHYYSIHQTRVELNQFKDELADIEARYKEYVESEKKILPDKQYEHIDNLEAKLRKLQMQSEEQEQIDSPSNNQNHEG